MSTTNIYIMRTAAELWELTGPDMWLYGWTDDHCAMLQGKGDRCIMPADEFAEYQRMRRRWQEAGQDLAGAPSVSMREVTRDEDEIFPDGLKPELRTDDLSRICESLACELTLIRVLVRSARTSLSIEDYGEALEGAFARLSVCIGCVEALNERLAGSEAGRNGMETRSFEDDEDEVLEALNEWHKQDSEDCEKGLLKGVPPEGGYAPWAVLRNMIGCAFLEGAVAQLTRPFVRTKGGPGAA